jgi:hypothetical protein
VLGGLRARRERPCSCTAKQRDELTPFQLIKLHPSSPNREVVQRSETAKVSQGLLEWCDNLSLARSASLQLRYGRRQTFRFAACRAVTIEECDELTYQLDQHRKAVAALREFNAASVGSGSKREYAISDLCRLPPAIAIAPAEWSAT